jgi:hypothetical protein
LLDAVPILVRPDNAPHKDKQAGQMLQAADEGSAGGFCEYRFSLESGESGPTCAKVGRLVADLNHWT